MFTADGNVPVKLEEGMGGKAEVLALLGKLPVIKYGTFSAHADWRVRLLENFDWLAPPFQYHHTKEEMLGWCEKEGIGVERMLEHGFIPKVGVRGRKT